MLEVSRQSDLHVYTFENSENTRATLICKRGISGNETGFAKIKEI